MGFCTYAASRMFYSMAEDGVLPRRLARLDGKQCRGTVFSPWRYGRAGCRSHLDFATNIVDAFGAISTWAGLMFLLVYLFVPLAAGRALWGPTAKGEDQAIVVPLIVFAVVSSSSSSPPGHYRLATW